MIETRINGRWTLLLPRHRAERPEWSTPLGWERERIASMALNLASGNVVIDVGAEEGDMSGLFASWGCQMVLVEPNPRVWPNIKAIFETNDLVDRVAGWHVGFCGTALVDPIPPGVSAYGGDAAGVWPACAEGPVIGDHGFLHLAEDVAPVTTIDLMPVTPDALTIDVEGAELAVLRGAHATLQQDRPLVWVSVHPAFMRHHFAYNPDQLHRYMRGLDYDGHLLASDHEEHWLFLPR